VVRGSNHRPPGFSRRFIREPFRDGPPAGEFLNPKSAWAIRFRLDRIAWLVVAGLLRKALCVATAVVRVPWRLTTQEGALSRFTNSRCRVKSHSHVSPCLTLLVPQPHHRPANRSQFPWSEGFDCIFRNEGGHRFKSRQLHIASSSSWRNRRELKLGNQLACLAATLG
jgi:hypothetical protein